ncbi:MAG: rRNA maturation RNase YbeY [Deltaproteobacteria bacterium]|nr:rRNA maturation RNase YbeY [Deltaproteobacteria bacterium]
MWINILNHHPSKRIPCQKVRKFLQKLLRVSGLSREGLNVVFLSDRQIRVYNKKYLRHDRPTDVIAFSSLGKNPPRPPLTKGGVGRFEFPFGELLISLDTAKRQAEELGHPFFQEIKILLIHGILHLLGYKDKKKRDCVRMWKETEKLLGGVSLI